MYTFLYKGPNSMVLHFFLGDCLLYKVNILFLMMDMSVLAWTCPQTLGPPSGHANMLRIFPARRRPRMKEPASGKQSQLDDEIAFRMQVCSFAKIPEKKVKNQKKEKTGDFLISQAASRQVSSALESLTSVFGMGTGVSSLL